MSDSRSGVMPCTLDTIFGKCVCSTDWFTACFDPNDGYLFRTGFSTEERWSISSSRGFILVFMSEVKLIEVFVKLVSFELF